MDFPTQFFLEKIGKKYISVDKIGIAPKEKAIIIARRVATERGENRNFYGWAVISVKRIYSLNCSVKVTPIREIPYHADIQIPDDAIENKDIKRDIAHQLAANSSWRGVEEHI